MQGIGVATSASAKNRLVGIGGASEGVDWMSNDSEQGEYDRTIGASTRIDAYTAALVSIEVGLGMVVKAVYSGALSPRARGNTVHVFTNNCTVLITLRILCRRSRQAIIGKILKHVKYL